MTLDTQSHKTIHSGDPVKLENLRRFLLRTLLPVMRIIGRLHLPFTRKLVTAADYRVALPTLAVGDVLLSRCRGEVSNCVIPGFYTHAALYIGEERVLEATGAGVHTSDLVDFVMRKDFIAILNPAFASPAIEKKAAQIAVGAEGRPYDYGFTSSEDAFYCAELIAWSYSEAMKPGESPFEYRLTLGVPTVTPQDFFNAESKWKLKLLLGGSIPSDVGDKRPLEVAILHP